MTSIRQARTSLQHRTLRTVPEPAASRQEPKKQEQDQQQPAVEQTAKSNINPGDDKHPDLAASHA